MSDAENLVTLNPNTCLTCANLPDEMDTLSFSKRGELSYIQHSPNSMPIQAFAQAGENLTLNLLENKKPAPVKNLRPALSMSQPWLQFADLAQ